MAEYIDRANLIARIEYYVTHTPEGKGEHYAYSVVLNEVLNRPAADVVPVVQGRWGTGRFNPETGNYEEQCTRCRNFSKEYGKPYCPNCGAKMDGGAE